VYLDGDELIIRGSVKCHRFRGFSRGHIDIAIVSAEGEVLQSLSALYYPRVISVLTFIGCAIKYYLADWLTIQPKAVRWKRRFE